MKKTNPSLSGLPENSFDKISKTFSRFPEVEKVVLYGSRAMGNYRGNSDIDLTLFGKNINLDLLLKIKTALDDLLLPYTIDLSVFDDLKNEPLQNHIEDVGVVFYENKNDPNYSKSE